MTAEHNPFDLDGQAVLEGMRSERDKARRAELENDIVWLMGGKRGRRVMYRLLEQTGVYRSCFDPNALQMARKEGERNVGLYLLSLIHENCPEKHVQMLNERDNGSE